jgi:hypothetical protein
MMTLETDQFVGTMGINADPLIHGTINYLPGKVLGLFGSKRPRLATYVPVVVVGLRP